MYKNLGWVQIDDDAYFSLKHEGIEWRLSVFDNDYNIRIEKFFIYDGISAADATDNYDCNIVFEGRIWDEKDLQVLMGWLDMPIHNLKHKYKVV